MTNYKLLNNTLQDKKPPTPFLMRKNTSVEKGKRVKTVIIIIYWKTLMTNLHDAHTIAKFIYITDSHHLLKHKEISLKAPLYI